MRGKRGFVLKGVLIGAGFLITGAFFSLGLLPKPAATQSTPLAILGIEHLRGQSPLRKGPPPPFPHRRRERRGGSYGAPSSRGLGRPPGADDRRATRASGQASGGEVPSQGAEHIVREKNRDGGSGDDDPPGVELPVGHDHRISR
jgi:hypothetical protein